MTRRSGCRVAPVGIVASFVFRTLSCAGEEIKSRRLRPAFVPATSQKTGAGATHINKEEGMTKRFGVAVGLTFAAAACAYARR